MPSSPYLGLQTWQYLKLPQPFASLVVDGHIRVASIGQNITHRGELLIVSGSKKSSQRQFAGLHSSIKKMVAELYGESFKSACPIETFLGVVELREIITLKDFRGSPEKAHLPVPLAKFVARLDKPRWLIKKYDVSEMLRHARLKRYGQLQVGQDVFKF